MLQLLSVQILSTRNNGQNINRVADSDLGLSFKYCCITNIVFSY